MKPDVCKVIHLRFQAVAVGAVAASIAELLISYHGNLLDDCLDLLDAVLLTVGG